MTLGDFHLIRPYWLLALIPFAAILVMLFKNRLSRGSWSSVCDAALLPYLLQDKGGKASRMPLILGGTTALLAIIALAGPTWQRLPSPVFRNESALVIALDLSRSMEAEDVKPSRLIRARYKIADLLQRRKDGQTALLVYAGDAFTVTPLTDDTETIASQLEALTTDIMPSQGSNAAAALNQAVQLMQQAGLPQGEIIMITDEADLDATLPAAKALDHYTLSILGVGTADGAPIPLAKGGFLKDEHGAIVVPKLDAAKLAKLAGAGGGVYQTLTADDSDIEALLQYLDRGLAEAQGKSDQRLLIDLWDDLGPWLVLAVLPLAALWFRKGLLCLALIVLLPMPQNSHALGWRDLWLTQDQQAAEAFEHKHYDRAAELFTNPDWKAAAQYRSGKAQTGKLQTPTTATGFYNQGNVLAKSNRFEEAIKAYEKALELKPDFEDAKYNKKLVEDALKQQKQQQQNPQQSDPQQDSQKEHKQDQQSGQQDQSGSDQKSEQKDQNSEQKDGDSKPEKSESGTEGDLETAEQKQQAEEQQAQETSANQAEEKKPSSSKQTEEPAQALQRSDETAQANEQWLKRIPDDPGGLLKRKFKYQYGQRRQRAKDTAQNW
ncbi:MAG: VWA domain-containing protein [Gammaproteobacteria bacterium]